MHTVAPRHVDEPKQSTSARPGSRRARTSLILTLTIGLLAFVLQMQVASADTTDDGTPDGSVATAPVDPSAVDPSAVDPNAVDPSAVDPTPTATPIPDADPADVDADCGAAPAPGQAQCMSVRRTDIVQPDAIADADPGEVVPNTNPAGYGPSSLISAYNLNTSRGSGQTVAIVDAYDDPNAEADLATYRAQYGLSACTTANGCFHKVNQNGAASPLPVANSGWAGEISLDVDMVSATCPQCNILLVEGNSSSFADLGTAVNAAVTLGAKFVSNSYGGADVSGYDSYYNHPGVAITASTGDNGYGVGFPASASTVTAVGGTSLSTAANARGWTETAWSGAGSGCSGRVAKPTFQSNVNTGCPNRAVADVSAVANPNTGVAVYDTYPSGGWGVYGGTSASSPIIASVYALAGTPASTDYPNTYPYKYSGSLNDVTSGSTGSCGGVALCTSLAGWDGPTGLGTPATAAAFSSTGSVGAPTQLGASITVTGQMTPGIAAAVSVTPILPTGDTVTSVSWTSARSDCSFTSAASASTSIICNAATTTASSVSATLTDSLGATKTVTTPITFSIPSTKRNISIALTTAGQSGSSVTACTAFGTLFTATVTDTTTGGPVKGITVSFTSKTGSAAATVVTTAVSGANGIAIGAVPASAAVTVASWSAAVGGFNAMSSSGINVTTTVCSPTLTAAADKTTAYSGDAVTISGVLTRTVNSQSTPIGGASLIVTDTVGGKATWLTNMTTAADGTYNVVVHPTFSGVLASYLSASTGLTDAYASAGNITISTLSPTLTASADKSTAAAGDAVTISGRLTRPGGAAMAGAALIVTDTVGGKATWLAGMTTASDGSYSVVVHPTFSGVLASYLSATSTNSDAYAAAGNITISMLTPTLTAAADKTTAYAGDAVTISGRLTRPGGVALAGVTLMVTDAANGSATWLTNMVTASDGSYSVVVHPTFSGVLASYLSSTSTMSDAYAAAGSIAISLLSPTLTASEDKSSTTSGGAVTIRGRLTRPGGVAIAGAALIVTDTVNGHATWLANMTTAADGSYSVVVHPTFSGVLAAYLPATSTMSDAYAAAGNISVS